MSAVAIEEKPMTSDTGSKPPPLQHLICSCQEKLNKGEARCGAKVSGKITWLRPSEQVFSIVCLVCHDLRDNKVPCRMCGKAPL